MRRLVALRSHWRPRYATPQGLGKTCQVRRGQVYRGFASSGHLWELIQYNAKYFNPHKMMRILEDVLELPRETLRDDPRLEAYLSRAEESARIYTNLREITAKDLAATIVACRQLGLPAAEDLSDTLVQTVTDQIPMLGGRAVSFYVTAFAKQQIGDVIFWRASAHQVRVTTEPFSMQVLVSLFDAFRKSGVRSEKLFTVLSRRIYNVLEEFKESHIPPVIATLVRVPMSSYDDKTRVVQVLLDHWLKLLRREQANPTGAISVEQILSLTVSLDRAPEDVNTAAFTRDVVAFVSTRFDAFKPVDLIVFLWALERLNFSEGGGSVANYLAKDFAQGLSVVERSWPMLQASSELSAQRLTQLSEVLLETRLIAKWPGDDRLQGLVLQELCEVLSHCSAERIQEILEVWSLAGKDLWSSHSDFSYAVFLRLEELLLESVDVDSVLPALSSAQATEGFIESLPENGLPILDAAIRSRSPEEQIRVLEALRGGSWERLAVDIGTPVAKPARKFIGKINGSLQQPDDAHDAESIVRAHVQQGCRTGALAVDVLRALEGAAPALRKITEDSTMSSLQMEPTEEGLHEGLESLCAKLVPQLGELPPQGLVSALRSCAVVGLPHLPLFEASLKHLPSLAGHSGGALLLEALEAFAALRLALPELQVILASLELDRRLPAAGLARLITAGARVEALDRESVEALLQRLLTVASPVRPLPSDSVATLCRGLYLSGCWTPNDVALRQLLTWVAQANASTKSFGEAHAQAVRLFVFAVLTEEQPRSTIEGLSQDLKAAAKMVLQASSHKGGDYWRSPVSDTTLKFRYEVATLLREHRRAYDLDVVLGPGAYADLALPGGALLCLDGPEAFNRPFSKGLRLIPAERRRGELMQRCLGTPGLSNTLSPWLELPPLPAAWDQPGAPRPLARLHWQDWSSLDSSGKLELLLGSKVETQIRFGRRKLP